MYLCSTILLIFDVSLCITEIRPLSSSTEYVRVCDSKSVDEYSGELSFYLGVFYVYNFSHVCLLLQRSQYKLLKKGKKSSLTEERVSLLEEIGFEWVVGGFVMPHLQTHASQQQRSASSSSNTNRQGPVRNPYISSNTNQQGPASTVPVTEEDWKEWEEEEEEEEEELLQEGYLLEMEEQSARRSGATPQRGLISLQAIRATRASRRGVTPSPQSSLRPPRSFLQQPLSWGSFEESVTYSVSDVNTILTTLRNNNIEHYKQSFDKLITVSCRISNQAGSFNIVRNEGGHGKKKYKFLAVLEFLDAKEESNDKLACQIDSSIVNSYFSPRTAVSLMNMLYFSYSIAY